jgi:hypothetical protein
VRSLSDDVRANWVDEALDSLRETRPPIVLSTRKTDPTRTSVTVKAQAMHSIVASRVAMCSRAISVS